MDHKEAGQGTPFDSMSHEQMLAWLDKANSGAVQGASDRLVSAAKEIRKIAEELKVRPQLVEWRGEGADAFRTWSADLANATLRLGAYSEGASKWLAQASGAIAAAQASMPRVPAGAQANLDAALGARNDPDSAEVARKATETLETHRQDAAAEMRRLAQSYAFSASQMDGLEKPAFPPPPGAFVPPAEEARYGSSGREFGTGSDTGGSSAYAATAGPTSGAPAGQVSAPSGSTGLPSSPAGHAVGGSRPVGMEIAGVTALPDAPSIPAVAPPGGGGGKNDGGSPPVTYLVPPSVGGGRSVAPPATGGGNSTGLVRPPVSTSGGGNLGAGASRLPRDGGIVGGRPVEQTANRSIGGLPRGTVVGGEGTHAGRAPMGHGAGVGGVGGGQNGIVGGRRLAGEAGGVVGSRPQQPGITSGRPFTPGGTGLVRGAASPGGARGTGPAGRGGNFTAQRPGDARRDEGERPDYLVEDEETWRRGGRQVVPPVID